MSAVVASPRVASPDRSVLIGQSDKVLLEGPHSRRQELWLVLRTVHDFIRGDREP